MRDTKIPFGEREGVLLRATEVANGFACNCICPGCRRPLNAANRGQKVVPHFRHVQSDNCTSGYKDGIRRAAIALIYRERHLLLPAFSQTVSARVASGHTLFREVEFAAKAVVPDAVDRFIDVGDVVAHAVLTVQGHQLLVRVKVSERAEHERYQRLASFTASSVEIDLSDLSLEQINDPSEFEHAVLCNAQNRSWIRSLRGEMLAKRAVLELGAEVQVHDHQWQQEQRRLLAIEQAREDEKALVAQQRADALEVHRRAQKAAAEEQRTAGLPINDGRSARKQREDLIVSQTLRASHEWGGEGVECSACCLLSPPGSQFCLYCTNETSTMSRVFVSADIASTIHFRMRSSAKPDRSLRMAPSLLVQPVPRAL